MCTWFSNRRAQQQRSVLPKKILTSATWQNNWAHNNADKIKQKQEELGRPGIGGWQVARAAVLKEVDEDEQQKAIEDWEEARNKGLSLETQIR